MLCAALLSCPAGTLQLKGDEQTESIQIRVYNHSQSQLRIRSNKMVYRVAEVRAASIVSFAYRPYYVASVAFVVSYKNIHAVLASYSGTYCLLKKSQ